MVKKLVNSYFKLLDEKLENGTIVVLIIAALVILVSIIISDIQIKINNENINNDLIKIEGKTYQLVNE